MKSENEKFFGEKEFFCDLWGIEWNWMGMHGVNEAREKNYGKFCQISYNIKKMQLWENEI